MASLISHWHW